jgi:transcriptional regulator with XRE-family HTH domain
MSIGERIHQIMHDKGITQKDFCKKTGFAQSTVSEWKYKKISPGADKVLAMCDALDITPYELLQSDSVKKGQMLDYIVVSEKSDGYELLIEFAELNSNQKARVMGYIASLKEKKD